MKKINIGLLTFCFFSLTLCAMAAEPAGLVDKLSAHEKMIWEAVKTKNFDSFRANTAKEILDIDATGVAFNKEQAIKTLGEFTMSEYSLSDFAVYSLDKDAVVLTYKSDVKGTMNGNPMSSKVLNTSTYVMEGGKWLPKFHTETPIQPPPPATK